MRPNSLQWRHRAMSAALAVSWASSIQLAGCLNNPTRSDLAGEAGKAALRAEEDIAQQKSQIALAAAEEEDESHTQTGKVVVAGGAVPATDSPILQVGGEAPAAAKTSFWSFLKPKPARPAIKDPFADRPELQASKTPTDSAATVGKARLPSSSPALPQKPAVEKPGQGSFSPDNWFEKEFARQTPFSSWDQAAQQEPVVKAVPSEAVSTQTPQNKSEAMPARSQDWAAQPVAEKISPVSAKLSANSRAADVASFEELEQRRSAAAATPTPVESIATRQQKLRIQALLSEAHTNSLRGEFHAAYRSALLAEKVANEHQIVFQAGEENPHDFARAIAAKIWRASDSIDDFSLAAAVPANRLNPVATANGASTTSLNSSNSSFNNSHSPFPDQAFATWQPLPDNIDQKWQPQMGQMKTTPARTMPASPVVRAETPPVADIMPEIRPWGQGRAIRESQPPREFSGLDAAGTALAVPTPLANSLPMEGIKSEPESTHSNRNDAGVQFAIAHSISDDSSPQLIDPFAQTENQASAGTGEFGHDRSGKTLATAMDSQRPLLMAPPTPADNHTQPAENSTLTWDDLSKSKASMNSTEHVRASDTNFKWRVTWSILGLIGAGIAAAIGLKVSRSNDVGGRNPITGDVLSAQSSQPAALNVSTLEMVTDTPASTDEPEIQPLQFKRVA